MIAGRRRAALLLVAAVLLAHALATDRLAVSIAQWQLAARAPERLQVAFVRELLPAEPAPPPAAAAPMPAPKPRRKAVATVPSAAASAVMPPDVPAASAPEPAPPADAGTPEAATLATEAAAPDAGAAADRAAAASTPDTAAAALDPGLGAAASAPSISGAANAAPLDPAQAAVRAARERFAWPPSTRLSYALLGNYRGEVRGSAQVEWLHVGARYQVHLDVTVGPGFAPLFTRRMTSVGETSAEGLAPQAYNEVTEAAFRAPREATIRFESDTVVLNDRQQRPREPGVQDAASQFVQLTWLFTTQPALQSAALPVALPRRIERITYEVRGRETLYTPIGALETIYVKPQRELRGGDLTAEVWVAPALEYLPVRIRLSQSADTWMDLTLASAPLQAAVPSPVASAPYSAPTPRTEEAR